MDERFKKYLPLGSVVMLRGGKKCVMITGYIVKNPKKPDKVYDYVGCLWPEGMITSDKNAMFDHKNIEKIFAIGYTNDEQQKFMGVLNTAAEVMYKRLEKEHQKNLNFIDERNSLCAQKLADFFKDKSVKQVLHSINKLAEGTYTSPFFQSPAPLFGFTSPLNLEALLFSWIELAYLVDSLLFIFYIQFN